MPASYAQSEPKRCEDAVFANTQLLACSNGPKFMLVIQSVH
jgi:hypothetical protein